MSRFLDVSVAQGTKIVEVFSAEPITGIVTGDVIFITGDPLPYKISSIEIEVGTNRKLIHLYNNWVPASAVNVAAAWMEMVPKLAEATAALVDTNFRYSTRIDNISKFTLDMGTVTMPGRTQADADVVLDTLPQIEYDMGVLTTQANAALATINNATAGLDQLEIDIDQAEADILAVNTTLQSTIDAKNLAAEYATNAYNVVVTGTGDYSALHYSTIAATHKVDAETARTGAEAARTGAEAARTGAETAESNVNSIESTVAGYRDIAIQYAINPVDQVFDTDKYSAKHYAAKAAESAIAAEAYSGGAATDTVNLGGIPSAQYARNNIYQTFTADFNNLNSAVPVLKITSGGGGGSEQQKNALLRLSNYTPAFDLEDMTAAYLGKPVRVMNDSNVFKIGLRNDADDSFVEWFRMDGATTKINSGIYLTHSNITIGTNVSGVPLLTSSNNGTSVINVISRHTASGAISVKGDDAMLIGCGESVTTLIDALIPSNGLVSENTYVTSDGNVFVYTNMQGGYSERKAFSFSSNGNFYIGNDIALHEGNIAASPTITTINNNLTSLSDELTRVKTMAMIGIWSVIHGS